MRSFVALRTTQSLHAKKLKIMRLTSALDKTLPLGTELQLSVVLLLVWGGVLFLYSLFPLFEQMQGTFQVAADHLPSSAIRCNYFLCNEMQ